MSITAISFPLLVSNLYYTMFTFSFGMIIIKMTLLLRVLLSELLRPGMHNGGFDYEGTSSSR